MKGFVQNLEDFAAKNDEFRDDGVGRNSAEERE